MSKEKKLLIATIILGAMLPISAFGLSFITEAFLVLGMFCGISALFCLLIYLDLKTGKKPNLIPIGLGMAFFGFIFLVALDFFPVVSIPLSALYAVAGLGILVKGIKDWREAKRNRAPKEKQPMNKKIYIGIGLLVGGFFATIVLFNILPLLMAIGHVMVVVGIVFLGRGIAERKNGAYSPVQTTNRTTTNTNSTVQVKTEYCARCGKNLTYLSNGQIFTIDGVKHCADCKTAIEQDIKNQHTVCSLCGVDLPVENMHVIDDALLCHSCFLKKYGNYNCFNKAFADYYAEDDKAADDAVIERIRKKEQAYLDKIQGSLVGGAIGDAFGYPVEFLSLDAIKQKYGPSGITRYELDKQTGTAVISDDTQMTLFTATGLLVGDTRLSMRGIAGEPSSYVFLSYLNWMETQGIKIDNPFRVSWLMDVKELYVRRAPGNTCLSALEGRNHKSDYATTRKPINNSKGCGGVMRVAPVGLFYNPPNIERVNEIAADIAAITHSHPLGYIPAAMLAHIVNRLIYGNCQRGNSLLHIIEESVETANAHYGDVSDMEYMASLIRRAIEFSGNNNTDAENIKALGEGWVAEEALAIAIYCALKYQNDFSKAMIASVNHDGDSDSTGAITGNILGALIGYAAIPDCWKKDLEIRDVILEVATDLCQGCQMSEYGTYNDPKWVSKYMQMKAY